MRLQSYYLDKLKLWGVKCFVISTMKGKWFTRNQCNTDIEPILALILQPLSLQRWTRQTPPSNSGCGIGLCFQDLLCCGAPVKHWNTSTSCWLYYTVLSFDDREHLDNLLWQGSSDLMLSICIQTVFTHRW